MKIAVLMENTALSPEFVCSHGLSLYIETKNHRILFDTGQDGGFLKNAERLGIDISNVDLAILSHGHYDHGGGIADFLQINKKAEIHIQKKAMGEFYAHDPDGSRRYIGLDPKWKDDPRIVFHTGDYMLDAELRIFAGVTGRECYSPANDSLYMSMNGHDIPDLFMHEQNLLVREGNHVVLFAGCAHNGLVNILKKAETFVQEGIDAAVGGMHLKGIGSDEEAVEFCRKFAEKLLKNRCRYYTCHCTGEKEYEILREMMGDRITYLSAGSIVEI